LEWARDEQRLRDEEVGLLRQFERYVTDILDRYPPPSSRHRENLVFAELYKAAVVISPDGKLRNLLIALMAAEVECRGPLPRTLAQSGRLAMIFEWIGTACGTEGLMLHAALAFERAAGIHLLLSQGPARDRCLHAKARFSQRATKRGLSKAVLATWGVLCGYGYKPYRILFWVAIQIMMCTLGVALAVRRPIWQGIYLGFTNYLDPHGSGEMTALATGLLVTEGYLSAMSLSVFFALLVHRWFRI